MAERDALKILYARYGEPTAADRAEDAAERERETPRLVLTVGLPRSGKSTWARAQGHPIVNPDSIRLALHGQRFVASAEPFVWAVARVMVEALFRAGHGTVLVDACNQTETRRAQWREWFPEARIELHVVGTPPWVCKCRAEEEGDAEILPVIERMAEAWDLPRPWLGDGGA